MVQADMESNYDEGQDEWLTPDASQEAGDESSWTEAIRVAVKDFVSVVGESSNQLASAAEQFAGQSLRAVDEAAEKARIAAVTSSDMATVASQAAAEARSAAESVSAKAEETLRAIEMANSSASDASEQARQAVASIVQSSNEAVVALDEKSSAAVESVNQSSAAAIESLNSSASYATDQLREEARLAAEQLKAEVLQQTQDAIEQIRMAAGDSRVAVEAAQQAATEARTAANDSLAHSERALEVAASPTVGAGAQEVLERLEGDYELLTKLVQELHTRIVSLTTPPVAAPRLEQPQVATSYEQSFETEPEFELAMASEAEVPTPLYQPYAEEPVFEESFYEEAEPALSEPAALSEAVMPTPPAVEEVRQPSMAGRVMVTIAPVPDFDRLLNLDGALGRMHGIANVSLADYAKEEVTFRLEVESPMSADDFARSLSESAGRSASVAGAEEGKLALRLAS